MARLRYWLPLLFAFALTGLPLHAQDINWQEAVARLARERTQAETCVVALKKYGNTATIDHGAVAYGEAKAEYDGIIAGLIVALAQSQTPASLPDLESRLRIGFSKREALCAIAQPLVPETGGEKGTIEEIVKGAVEPLIKAIQAIYLRSKDDGALMRKTIQTQLETTTWRDFASVKPSS